MASESKLIVLDVNEGDFDRGFAVVLRIGNAGKPHSVEFRGRFPPAADLPELYTRWQKAYYRWGDNHRWWRMMRLNFPPQTTNVSYWDDCNSTARALQARLQQWFDQPDMRDLREHILEEVRRDDFARLIVRSRDRQLRQLPWHLWSLLDRRPQLEIAVDAHYAENSRQLSSPVKILAVLGDSRGIDVAADQAALKQLPNATVEFLVEPTRQALSDRLFEQPWDILFFAGHSHSEVDCETGYIWINQHDRLSPTDLKYALSRAARNGLQLAILNSCNGLGLAREFADLQVPQLIVMREPIPDPIAQTFLQYFLKSFARGDSFYLSVRKAREQLQSLETQYPCASWLPVICQNPAAPNLTYPQHNLQKRTFLITGVAIALLGITALVQQQWQDWQMEQRLSSGEKILVSAVTNPDKTAGVLAYGRSEFNSAAERLQRSLHQQRNDPEALIYLNNARIGARPALTLATSVPIGTNPNVAQEILRGVAQAQTEVNITGGINGKLLKVIIANDDNNANLARAIAARYVQMPDVLAVVGHNSSDASVAAAPIYVTGGLVMITPTSFSDKLSSSGPYIFRMVPSIRFLADKLAAYYIKANPSAQIGICSEASSTDNESYRNQFANGVLAQSISSRGARLIQVTCDFSDPNFSPDRAITDLINQGADTLLLAPFIDRIDMALQLAKLNRGRLKLLSSPTMYTAQTVITGQAAVHGLTLTAPWHPAMLPTNPFPKTSTQLWGGAVNWRTAMAYDATRSITAGLERAIALNPQQQPTRNGLKDVLRSADFSVNGASGTIRFIQSGERQLVPEIGILVQVRPVAHSAFGYEFVPLQKGKRAKGDRR